MSEKIPSSSLEVLGQTSRRDDEFLHADRQISSPEFLTAVLEDRREDVAKMIVHDDRLVGSRDAAGASAILLARYHGLDDMLALLLRSGVDLDVFEAAAVGDAERVRELVSADRSLLEQTSGDGFPPLQLACYFGQVETAETLLSLGAEESGVLEKPARNPTQVRAVHSAAACADGDAALDLVRRLLGAGAEVDAEQAGGFRPLHSAAAAGRCELVDLLLERGADAAAESDVGKTPADFAEERGHPGLAEYLRSASS